MRTKRVRSVAVAAVVAAGLALVVSACGGGGGGGSSSTTSSTQGKTFSQLKVVWGTTDYMDPGLSYRLESWQIFQDVYLGLLAKRYGTCGVGAGCTKIIPALAQSLPKSNSDGTDLKFTLRKGLKYSNGEAVKASDFKNSIIRDFKLNSPGIGFFSNIVRQCRLRREPEEVLGHLGDHRGRQGGHGRDQAEQPQSDFLYILTTFFAAMVPSSTPQKDTENPPPAAAGPYYISQYKPSRSFTVLRNPHYTPIPGIPTGNPDKITAIMTDDLAQSAQYIQSGQYDYDENTAADRPAEAAAAEVRRPDQALADALDVLLRS